VFKYSVETKINMPVVSEEIFGKGSKGSIDVDDATSAVAGQCCLAWSLCIFQDLVPA
jgi:hypothetical protein